MCINRSPLPRPVLILVRVLVLVLEPLLMDVGMGVNAVAVAVLVLVLGVVVVVVVVRVAVGLPVMGVLVAVRVVVDVVVLVGASVLGHRSSFDRFAVIVRCRSFVALPRATRAEPEDGKVAEVGLIARYLLDPRLNRLHLGLGKP